MSQYRVDKDDVGATLHLADGSTVRGSLFLSPFSPTRSGPQTVAELLAEAGAALPFATPEGKFVLVGTAAVAAVALHDAGADGERFWSRAPVSLRLAGGHAFRGALLLEEGAGHRLSDAVRAPEPWLLVEAAHALLWIAKAHLVTLEPEAA